MASVSDLPRGLRYGSVLIALGGLVPFLAATVLFVAFMRSEANPGQPWLSGQFPPGPASYSLDTIRSFSSDVATAFVTAQHMELVNVMNSGALVVLLSLFGLRRRQKWSWYALLFTALWPGLNDAWALIAAHEPPIPLVGEAVILVGLFLARPAVFAKQPAAT
jgi:hypothetical protein